MNDNMNRRLGSNEQGMYEMKENEWDKYGKFCIDNLAHKKYNWNVQKADNRLFKTYLNEPKIKP